MVRSAGRARVEQQKIEEVAALLEEMVDGLRRRPSDQLVPAAREALTNLRPHAEAALETLETIERDGEFTARERDLQHAFKMLLAVRVEEDVPAGYVSDDASKDVTVTTEATCASANADKAQVSFHNTPLTNVTVSVDSQVAGGTASTMVCTDSEGNESSDSTGANGDGSLSVNDLTPTDPTVTLTCEVTVDP